MASFLCPNYRHFMPSSPLKTPPKNKTEKLQGISMRNSLRDKGLSKKPMWRTAQDMSSEAIQAARVLKLVSADPERVAQIFETKISRLLKSDLLSLLYHLQRSDSCDLAVMVFEFARKESWYKPELRMFSEMIYMLGRNRLVDEAERFFLQLREEGLEPDTRAFTEILRAYLEAALVDKAMQTYKLMKLSGCKPDELTFTLLLRNLERFGEAGLANYVKGDVAKYIEEWEVFLRNLERKKSKKTSSP